jgi:1-acyl-sn-glycerol-3-phosphate acyltransferase
MASSYRRLHPLIHLGMRAIIRLLAPRWRVTGRNNIPYRGPVIFAPNHISDADPPVLGAALRFPPWFMAKRELWEIGWLAPILDYVQSFPVDPASPDRTALKFAAELLAKGEAIIVFPEGKISPTGELCEILPGTTMLALRSNVPIIPVGIYGAQKLIPYGSTKPCFTWDKVRVHFGPPLDLSDLKSKSGREAREAAAERLETAIRNAVEIASGKSER